MKQKYLPLPTLTESDIKCFWSKVDKRSPDNCWEWTATKDEFGRGLFRLGPLYKAPRISFFLANGIDPGETDVCHTCDIPSCCNPAHLWKGTRRQNNDDRDEKGHQISHPAEEHGMVILTETQVKHVLTSPQSRRSLVLDMGVSEVTISAIRCNRLWRHIDRSKYQQPSRSRARLTKKDILEIRDAHSRGSTYKELATKYQTDRMNITSIIKRKTWKHV